MKFQMVEINSSRIGRPLLLLQKIRVSLGLQILLENSFGSSVVLLQLQIARQRVNSNEATLNITALRLEKRNWALPVQDVHEFSKPLLFN